MAYDAEQQPTPDKARVLEMLQHSDRLFVAQRQQCMLWQSLAELFFPERADFISQRAEGAERYEGIFDSEPQLMRRDLANNLGAMLRTRGRDWFFLRAADERLMEDEAAKVWCEEGTRRIRNVIYSSRANFTAAMAQSDHDYVCFGNAVVRHTFNRDESGLLFAAAHLRDCAWSENEEGAVDEMHEKMHLPLRKVGQLFGPERLPPKLRDQLQKDPTQKVWLRRIVKPMDEYANRQRGVVYPRDARFSSVYVLEEECAPLAETFFRTFPYWIRRWMTVSGEAYGRSPAAGVALADARTLNVAQAALLKSIEWAVDPPKVAVDDSVVGEIRLEAGGITYVDAEGWEAGKGEPIRSLTAGNPSVGHDFMDRGHMRLGRAFFQNLLKLPEREMTAYEAGERMEMYTREAAPIFEPMEAENGILMEGVFERCLYKGLFDEPPEALQGTEARFEFETPLSIAMRKMRANQAQQAKASLAQSAQLAPEILDNVNFDQMTRDELEGIGPIKWLRPKEEVAAIRQQKAEAAAQAKQEAMMMQAAEMAAKARPETLAAAENGMSQLQGEGGEQGMEQPQQGGGAGIDWAALMSGAAPADMGGGAMPQQAAAPAPAAPPAEDRLASILEAQGSMFAQALDRLGEKLTAPRVAVRDKDGKITGSRVDG